MRRCDPCLGVARFRTRCGLRFCPRAAASARAAAGAGRPSHTPGQQALVVLEGGGMDPARRPARRPVRKPRPLARNPWPDRVGERPSRAGNWALTRVWEGRLSGPFQVWNGRLSEVKLRRAPGARLGSGRGDDRSRKLTASPLITARPGSASPRSMPRNRTNPTAAALAARWTCPRRWSGHCWRWRRRRGRRDSACGYCRTRVPPWQWRADARAARCRRAGYAVGHGESVSARRLASD